LEVTVDELCKGYPDEFKDFMNYCRKLSFTDDPDYKFMIGLFEGCMKKNGYDPKATDFIWTKNILEIKKRELKEQMMKAINMPAKAQNAEGVGQEETKGGVKKLDKNSEAVN
jgi:hypothetical protein